MQTLLKLCPIILASLAISFTAEAQLLNRVRDNIKQRAEDRVVNKSGEAADQVMDEIENDLNGEDNSNETENAAESSGDSMGKSAPPVESQATNHKPGTPPIQNFKSYDFVPGDRIIYEYDMAGEVDSEIPGRMLIQSGSAEIQTALGEKCIMIPDESDACFSPLMTSNSYLPEQFTIEFDMLLEDPAGYNLLNIELKGDDDGVCSYGGIQTITLTRHNGENHYSWRTTDANGSQMKFPKASDADLGPMNGWRHVAIYVNKNIGKIYVDQHRIGTVNTVQPGTRRIEFMLRPDAQRVFFKNFRIAAGGTDAYQKVVTSGKFIAHGILFDVNKATLKPQSMGTINEIAKMLKAHTDLRFEIGGHTDSDGTADANVKLSLARAESVKSQLVSMGIDASRLTTKGYGSSQPVSDNLSMEGKANNRRVEFKKL